MMKAPLRSSAAKVNETRSEQPVTRHLSAGLGRALLLLPACPAASKKERASGGRGDAPRTRGVFNTCGGDGGYDGSDGGDNSNCDGNNSR